MKRVRKRSARDLSYGLAGPAHLPLSEREEALRDALQRRTPDWRSLKSGEIEQLGQGGNTASDWGSVLVHERFNPRLVRNCHFHGLVRIGELEQLMLEAEGIVLPVGLYDSTIISCDIGDDCAIHGARYLAHYVIADNVMIHGVGRMMTTPRAHFGHGIIKEGEDESDRRWIEVASATGARGMLAFDGILPADACLWSMNPADDELRERLRAMTDRRFDPRPGYYGTVGEGSVILGCGTLVDAAVGAHALIDGAERLENVTVRSCAEEPTQIGEGVTLSDGIVGFGCRVQRGARAKRFVMGTGARLDLGARVEHVFLGDNSTVRCCEVLYSLVLPHHVQHHNNSFLTSSTILGQSNIAAGATIGSDHNSRAPDAELRAGRGFWPGLCANFKFPCRFASFVLVVKGSYPQELDVRLPFSLLAPAEDGLLLMPGYWFSANMYALKRNEHKWRTRDRRVHDRQRIVTEALAPDTVEEMFAGLGLLEEWVGRSSAGPGGEDAREAGRRLLEAGEEALAGVAVLATGVENSTRPVRVRAAARGWAIYREMIHYYAMTTLLGELEREPGRLEELGSRLGMEPPGRRERRWVNLGGMLVAGSEYEALLGEIRTGKLALWDAVHQRYERLWEDYPRARARHAYGALVEVNALDAAPTVEQWREFVERAVASARRVADCAAASRGKDLTQPFRLITFEGPEDARAVYGTLEEDPVLAQARAEAERVEEWAGRVLEGK